MQNMNVLPQPTNNPKAPKFTSGGIMIDKTKKHLLVLLQLCRLQATYIAGFSMQPNFNQTIFLSLSNTR
jgi:hypothetical protein